MTPHDITEEGTMPVTLAERNTKLAQQRSRLEAAEAKLKTQVRKARTRNLIAAGALVEQAGLLDLQSDELLRTLQGVQAVLTKLGAPALLRALQTLENKAARSDDPSPPDAQQLAAE